MNRLLLYINVVLVFAVGYLYYLHFEVETEPVETVDLTAALSKTDARILYINSDSLLDNYEYYKAKKADLEKRQEQIRLQLKSTGDKLQQDVEAYQQRAESLTPSQRQQMEESLMMRQQQLVQQKERLLGQLDEEQGRYSDSLYYRLSAFLKEFNKGKNVQFVLGFQHGGGILYANDSLDITGPVLKGLNNRWVREQGGR